MIEYLTDERFSVNELVVGALTSIYLYKDQYITAGLVFVFGVIYCVLMDMMKSPPGLNQKTRN